MKKIYVLITIIIFTGMGLSPDSRAQEQKAAPAAQTETKKPAGRNLAILIFDGVQIIDYTGPYETFGHVYNDDTPAFNMYTVSEKTDPITTSMGMSVNPKYSIDNAPEPDILVVPGGDVRGQVANPAVIKWVQDRAQKAELVMSVCNGAFILAKAGLLDGLKATTTAGLIPRLREAAPKTNVVDDQRFVDNGKIITAAGLSSGIDGALHVIERLFGKGTAQMAALGMEYNWDPDSKYARAALADRYMRFNYELKTAPGGWVPLSREGDRDQWENRWSVITESSAAEVMNTINTTIAAGKMYDGSTLKWTRSDADAHQNLMQSSWRFNDDKGGSWNGIARLDPVAGAKNQFTLSVKVVRAGANAREASK
jgi:putative intracellular protease/amidase